MAALNLGIPYITRAELAALQPKLDLSGFTDDDEDNLVLLASRAIDGYTATSFGAQVYTEREPWRRESRRSYPNQWPIIQIARYRIYISNTQYATIAVGDIFVNNENHYIEVASMALITSLAPPLLSLGLTEPVVEMIYVAGNGAWEDSGATLGAALDATATEFDISDQSKFSVGDFIRIDSEWMRVKTLTDATPDKMTVEARGAYGTTAATHTNATAIQRLASDIPDDIKVAVAMTAAAYVNDQILQGEGLGNLKQATIGSYSIAVAEADGVGGMRIPPSAQVILDRYRRALIA